MKSSGLPLHNRLRRCGTDSAVIVGLLDEVAALNADEQAREFGDCMSAIAQSSTLSVCALARWLAGDTHTDIGKHLVHNLSVNHLDSNELVRFDLSVLQTPDALLVACRLCALATTPAVSLGWTLGLFRFAEQVAIHHAHELVKYHMREFPFTTQRLLTAVDAETMKALPVIAEAVSALKDESETLNSAPRLKEFAMSRDERIALDSLKRREQREIHRHAEQSSVLLPFFKQQHFKYSREAVIEVTTQDQTFEQVLSMQPHRVSVELPISELLDPLTGPLRRNRLWEGSIT
jgi:hypothetical protein